MEKVEDIVFKSGVASSTAFQVFESVQIDVVNDALYTIVLVVTILVGLKQLKNKK